jgi:hypothetical protein
MKNVKTLATLLFGLFLVFGTVSGQGKKSQPAYWYEFEQPNFVISKIEIGLDEGGHGTLAYWQKDVDPVNVEITLRPDSVARLKGMAEKISLLPEDTTPSDRHLNLGKTKLVFSQKGEKREAEFTYTPNQPMNAFANFFRGLVTQHQRKSQLEVARKYQPLDTPKILKDLESDLNGSRIAEPAALASLLKSLSTDERLPLIARNQAKKLFERVGK